MKYSCKPVRKCHKCLLNLSDVCWLYPCPKAQWEKHRVCPGFENEQAYKRFREWLEEPNVLSRKSLRQHQFRRRRISRESKLEYARKRRIRWIG